MQLIKKNKSLNEYTWEGLTEGKLIALANVLQGEKETQGLTTLQEELYIFLTRHLESIGVSWNTSNTF